MADDDVDFVIGICSKYFTPLKNKPSQPPPWYKARGGGGMPASPSVSAVLQYFD